MSELAEFAVADGIGRLRLNRPAKRNALDQPTADAVIAGIEAIDLAAAAVAVLEAEGPVFCSGEDLAAAEPPYAGDRVLAALRDSPLPWIAKLEGPAIGVGVALVAACPLAVATPSTWLGLPEIEHGAFPTSVFAALAPAIGARRALDLCLSGRRIDAEEALRLGVVGALVPEEEIGAEVDRRAGLLAAHPEVARAALRQIGDL